MPQFLSLDEQCLDRTTKLDLAIPAAVMLWPESQDMQAKWIDAAITEQAVLQVDELPQNMMRDLFLRASKVPPKEDMKAEAYHCMAQGFVAGEMLCRAYAASIKGEEVDIGVIRAEILTVLEPVNLSLAAKAKWQARIVPTAMSTMAEIWKRYRTVSPLWAAYLVACVQGDKVFPCRVEKLGEFLGTAETIRLEAESIALKRGHGTLLQPEEAIRAPVYLALPTVSFAPRIDPD